MFETTTPAVHRAARLWPLVAAALCTLVAACTPGTGQGPGRASGSPESAVEGPVHTYQVRGEIAALPMADDPSTELTIRHEAIDDFTDIDGDVVGMSSMTMPFPLAAGVSLAGLAVGDRVAFTLEIEWQGNPPYRITRIDKLPPDTALEFRAAR